MSRPVAYAYRPHVLFHARHPAVAYDWRSHGMIGISTNDPDRAELWRTLAREAGYVNIREAEALRGQVNAQARRAYKRLTVARPRSPQQREAMQHEAQQAKDDAKNNKRN